MVKRNSVMALIFILIPIQSQAMNLDQEGINTKPKQQIMIPSKELSPNEILHTSSDHDGIDISHIKKQPSTFKKPEHPTEDILINFHKKERNNTPTMLVLDGQDNLSENIARDEKLQEILQDPNIISYLERTIKCYFCCYLQTGAASIFCRIVSKAIPMISGSVTILSSDPHVQIASGIITVLSSAGGLAFELIKMCSEQQITKRSGLLNAIAGKSKKGLKTNESQGKTKPTETIRI